MYFCGPWNVDVWWEACKPLIYNFNNAFTHYIKTTAADRDWETKIHVIFF